MKKLKYIFFSLILILCINNNVYANNTIQSNNLDEIKTILNTHDSVNINLNYNDETIAKRKTLDLIKGKEKTIRYNIINNNEIIYSYIFNGKYFNKSYNDIDLKLEYTSNYDIYINEYFDKKRIIINTKYTGYFPKGTVLSIKNSNRYKNIYLYDINNYIKQIENISNTKDFIEINVNKGNIYIITNKKLINNNIIKIYIVIIIIFIIELIFLILIIIKKNIELPKLK